MLAWKWVNNFQNLGNKCPVLPIGENTASSQHSANSCIECVGKDLARYYDKSCHADALYLPYKSACLFANCWLIS